MRKVLLILAAVVSISFCSDASWATVMVYDNGLPGSDYGGSGMTNWIQANDFSFTSPATLTAARFWVSGYSSASAYYGSISWFIYSDNGGHPGDTIFSGLTAATLTPSVPTPLGHSDQYDLTIGALSLPTGTFWLGLKNGPMDYILTGVMPDMCWELAPSNNTAPGYENFEPFNGPWGNNTREHAFQLFGEIPSTVPEPATMLLLPLGLAGFRFFRRKKA